jgi:hypothetical protein
MNFLLTHWRSILAVLIALATSLAILVVQVAGDEVAGIGYEMGTALPVLQLLVVTVGGILWGIRCWLYTMRWKLKIWSLHKAFNTVIGVLLVASIWVIIEIVLTALRVLTEPDVLDNPNRLSALRPLRVIPHFHPPMWMELVLLILAIVMVWHHWSEWKLRKQNFEMPRITAKLLLELDKARSPGSNLCTPEAEQIFLDSLMTEMKKRLGATDKKRVEFSLMALNRQEELVTLFVHPYGGSLKGNMVLKREEGGAGTAYKTKSAIYIPSTKHRMGINVDTNKTMGPIYKPDPTPTPVRCLFCVPIFSNGGVVAVLNIVSTKRSAFSAMQLDIGRLIAAIISTIG